MNKASPIGNNSRSRLSYQKRETWDKIIKLCENLNIPPDSILHTILLRFNLTYTNGTLCLENPIICYFIIFEILHNFKIYQKKYEKKTTDHAIKNIKNIIYISDIMDNLMDNVAQDFKIRKEDFKDDIVCTLVCEFWASFKTLFPRVIINPDFYIKWAKLDQGLRKNALTEAISTSKEPPLEFERKYFLSPDEVIQISRVYLRRRSEFLKNQITDKNNPIFERFLKKFTSIFGVYSI